MSSTALWSNLRSLSRNHRYFRKMASGWKPVCLWIFETTPVRQGIHQAMLLHCRAIIDSIATGQMALCSLAPSAECEIVHGQSIDVARARKGGVQP